MTCPSQLELCERHADKQTDDLLIEGPHSYGQAGIEGSIKQKGMYNYKINPSSKLKGLPNLSLFCVMEMVILTIFNGLIYFGFPILVYCKEAPLTAIKTHKKLIGKIG